MFVLVFFLVMSISGFVTNKLLGIDDNSAEAYSYSKNDSLAVGVSFIAAILLQALSMMTSLLDSYYWLIVLAYSVTVLFMMIILSQIRKQALTNKREELDVIWQIVKPLITSSKDAEIDYNNPGFELEYKHNNVNKINVSVEPTKFSGGVDKVLTPIVAQLNAFLPTYTWNYESHLEERYLTLIGYDKPPTMARWPGSWLRHFRYMPMGMTGKGEIAYQPDSVPKAEYGRSQFIDENGNVIGTDKSLPTQPQGLICGAPLGLATIIPTTKGYKTMETIAIGDEVFDINNKPVKVLGKSEINYNPDKVYRLRFEGTFNDLQIIADSIHKFPEILSLDFRYKETSVEEMIVGKTQIIGNLGAGALYTLIEKEEIAQEPVQCILVDSDSHLFLITDTEHTHNNWNGGEKYPYEAIYTRNTGGGKAVWVEQEIDE